jgi:flagellar biosynthesis anti-sigma factor FlgM
MRVDRSSVENIAADMKSNDNAKAKATEGSDSAADDSGAVVVQPRASELSQAHARGQSERAGRLEKVRGQIRDGSYKVDVERLANKIADEELGKGEGDK